MESLSRVRKNQNIRNEIENDREEALVSPALSSYANRLNKINPILSSVAPQSKDQDYRPLHTRREQAYQTPLQQDKPVAEESFNSNYINDFLEEVKAYNITRGYRLNEDTDKEILKPVQPEVARSQPVLEKPAVQTQTSIPLPPDPDPLNDEIKKILANDFNPDDTFPLVKDPAESNSGSSKELKLVVEETQKIRVQLSEYEKGLVDMNQSVLSSNRILNIVVFVLVLVLMIMLGAAIYWVLYSKGYY